MSSRFMVTVVISNQHALNIRTNATIACQLYVNNSKFLCGILSQLQHHLVVRKRVVLKVTLKNIVLTRWPDNFSTAHLFS